MALLSSGAKLTFTLFVWLASSSFIFVSPSLSWVKYPILLNIESFSLLFVIACIIDASNWKPWKRSEIEPNVQRRGKLSLPVIEESFGKYVTHFGSLALLWSLEIVLQKVLFSSLFPSASYVSEESQTDSDFSLTCMEGTVTFSLRSLSMFVLWMLFFAENWRRRGIKLEMVVTLFPVVFMSIGGFLSVWETEKASASTKSAFLVLLWILLRSSRLAYVKWVQTKHQKTLGFCRFVRLLYPLIVALLVICFMFLELPDMKKPGDIFQNPEISSDADQLELFTAHITKMVIYMVFAASSLSILFQLENAVTYNVWLSIREITWNVVCTSVTLDENGMKRYLQDHQFAGIGLFVSGCATYAAARIFTIYWVKTHRNRASTPMVDFRNIRHVDLDTGNVSDEETLIRTKKLRNATSYSDPVEGHDSEMIVPLVRDAEA